MKRRTRTALIVALAIFVLLFALRLVDKLSSSSEYPTQMMFEKGEITSAVSNFRKSNYASERIIVPQGSAQQIVDQKYERVANMRAKSRDFDTDAARVREIAAKAAAVIQRENAYGLPGSRTLSLALGVVPAAFDGTVESLRGVGKLLSITVTKTDRTGDFKALEAKRLSLEKTRDGLKALRKAGAALSDLMALETKILEIEGQIQELGVSLGDFSETNSFCTINLDLAETSAPPAARLLAAALDALGWALLVELGLALAGLGASGIAFLAAIAYEKYRKAEGGAAAQGGPR
jgi:hypothetical protein